MVARMSDATIELANGNLRITRTGPQGRLGMIELNRPRQLNALTGAMIDGLAEVVAAWRADASIEQIVIFGAGERGLCAGGDVAELRAGIVADGHIGGAERVLGSEYRLDATWAELPQPVVAVMDGHTLGGGVGLSGHASIRVVTERSRVGMPEAAIGFSPDVGGSYLLARMPGRLGEHAGVTGARLNAADAIATGFADWFIPSDRIPQLLARLAQEPAAEVVADLAEDPGESQLLAEREWIDEVYSAATLQEVVARLQEHAPEHPIVAEALAAIMAASPLAAAATLELVRRNRDAADLRAAIDLEFRVGIRLIAGHDFSEGVRAMLVDKDRQPKWQPASLDAVTEQQVAALFDEAEAPRMDWSLGPLGLRDSVE